MRRKRAEQRPLLPEVRRRDGGAGEAVTRPVAVIRRTTREGHELDRTEQRVPKEMVGRRLSQDEASGCWLSSNEVAPLTSISEFGGGKCSRHRG